MAITMLLSSAPYASENGVLKCKTAGIQRGLPTVDIIKICEVDSENQAKMEECIIKMTKNFTSSYFFSDALIAICSR